MRHDTIASFLQKKFLPKLSLTGVLHPGDDALQDVHPSVTRYRHSIVTN